MALLQEALHAHAHRYKNAHIYSLAWIFLLKFIYVTDWLDPKSHLHILLNKFLFLPESLLSFSLSPHKTYTLLGWIHNSSG